MPVRRFVGRETVQGKAMSKQDKPRQPEAGEKPKRPNPAIEVVNVYGSGPLPIGERQPEKPRRKTKPEKRGALSTSLEGKE